MKTSISEEMCHWQLCRTLSNTIWLYTVELSVELFHFTMNMSGKRSPKRKTKCPLLEIEEQMYLDNILTSNGADTVAKRIYEVIRDAEGVSFNLKTLYREELFARNATAKRRLRNHMYTIKHLNRHVHIHFALVQKQHQKKSEIKCPLNKWFQYYLQEPPEYSQTGSASL